MEQKTPRVKVSTELAKSIRREYIRLRTPMKELAARHNLNIATISAIVNLKGSYRE